MTKFRKKIWYRFAAVVLLTIFLLWLDLPDPWGPNINLAKLGFSPEEGQSETSLIKRIDVHLGLDLKGGSELIYKADLSQIPSENHEDSMVGVRDVIERRVNAFGVSEARVYQNGTDRLTVELPGIKDLNAAVAAIGETPTLLFLEENPDYSVPEGEAVLDENNTPAFIPTELSGKQLEKAQVVFSQQGVGAPQISLQFDSEGAQLFADITERNVGKRVAITLDNQIISAPVVNERITGGQAVISGDFQIDEAKELARNLNAGALPVPIELIHERNIGATLGRVSVEQSLVAGLVGLLAIVVFMVFFYRLPGIMAVFALITYALFALAIFKLIPVTLTLAGVAGFILSIGMAVDANVLIFERMKEELRNGGELVYSADEGFKGAWSSIRDSNVSTLITCIILYWFGTSIIKGFALTLGVGVLVSMFSAIVVTRTYIMLIVKTGKKGSWFWGL